MISQIKKKKTLITNKNGGQISSRPINDEKDENMQGDGLEGV